MRLFTKLLGSALIALATTQTANAATFDFVSYASGNEGSYNPYVSPTVDGITITATGQQTLSNGETDTGKTAYAYLDDHWSQRDAGLGVCKTFTTGCGADDNVTDDEKLTLDFGQVVTITEITMANGDHYTNNWDGDFGLRIDGGSWQTIALAAVFNTPITGTIFEFWNNNGSTDANKEFYISTMTVSAVPIPAAIWLFGSVMLGFVGIRRNNKKPA